MPRLPFAIRQLRYHIFYGALLRKYPLWNLGDPSTGCEWFFCPEQLNRDSIVYTGGVGKDITFEHALVQRIGCTVHLVDPSPTGVETMAKPENQIPQFKFTPVGLAAKCGTLKLAPPRNAEEGSWFTQPTAANTVEVPCVDLSTLMKQNGHDHVDLLKIDIEGAEYGVLDDLRARKLPIKQVMVEFHAGNLPGYTRGDNIRAILLMVAAGYKLLKQDGGNHTFYKPNLKVNGSRS